MCITGRRAGKQTSHLGALGTSAVASHCRGPGHGGRRWLFTLLLFHECLALGRRHDTLILVPHLDGSVGAPRLARTNAHESFVGGRGVRRGLLVHDATVLFVW